MSVQQQNGNACGALADVIQSVFGPPIVSLRAPTGADKAQFGTLWIFKTANAIYVITSIVNNVANWELLAVGGGAGAFNSLTVLPGPISLTGTTGINDIGAATTTIGVGGTGIVQIGNVTSGTAIIGVLDTSDAITIHAGGLDVLLGGITVAAGGITATTGDVTITDGDLTLTTPTTRINMPGFTIQGGAGVPANGLAVNTGDLYVNQTATTTTTRMYIAVSAGVWTHFTTAA